jgi:hypothetical protein
MFNNTDNLNLNYEIEILAQKVIIKISFLKTHMKNISHTVKFQNIQKLKV